jgi:hypothetical protein
VITGSALVFDDGVTLPFAALDFGTLRPPSIPRTADVASSSSLKVNLVGAMRCDGVDRSWKVKFVNIASYEQQVLVTETLRRGIAAAAPTTMEASPLRRKLTLSALEHLMHEWTVMETVLRSNALARARSTARDLAAVEALLLGIVTTGNGAWRPGVTLDANSPVRPDHARAVAQRAYEAEAARLRALGHGGAQRNLERAARGAALLWQEAPMVAATRTFACSWGEGPRSRSGGDDASDAASRGEAEAAAALLARAGEHAMRDVATRWFGREQGGRVLIGRWDAAAAAHPILRSQVAASGVDVSAPPLLSPTSGQAACTDFHGTAEELRSAFGAAMAVREDDVAEHAALDALMELVPLLCRDEVLRFAQGVVRLAQPCSPHTFFTNSGRRVPPPLLFVPRRCAFSSGSSASPSDGRDVHGAGARSRCDVNRDVDRDGDALFEVYSVVEVSCLYLPLYFTRILLTV